MHITKFVPLLRPRHGDVVSLRHCANCGDSNIIAYQHRAQCHSNLCNWHTGPPSTKTAAAMLLNELHKRFQPIMDVNSDSFNPVPSAACLLDPVFAQVLLIPEQAPLLHAAKLMVISMCDNPVAPATAATAAMIDSKGKAAFAKKLSFLANKSQAATSTGTLSIVTNQETVQGQLVVFLCSFL